MFLLLCWMHKIDNGLVWIDESLILCREENSRCSQVILINLYLLSKCLLINDSGANILSLLTNLCGKNILSLLINLSLERGSIMCVLVNKFLNMVGGCFCTIWWISFRISIFAFNVLTLPVYFLFFLICDTKFGTDVVLLENVAYLCLVQMHIDFFNGKLVTKKV